RVPTRGGTSPAARRGRTATAAASAASTAGVLLVSFGLLPGEAVGLFLGLAGRLDAVLIALDGRRGRVFECGQLRLQLAQVRGLLIEGRLRRHRRILRFEHGVLGDRLEAVALLAGDDGLIAECLRV